MKNNYITIIALLTFTFNLNAQITFNGCHGLFADQNYIFSNVGTDATGRNIYETIPITGD